MSIYMQYYQCSVIKLQLEQSVNNLRPYVGFGVSAAVIVKIVI
jgi:hypothetical protein